MSESVESVMLPLAPLSASEAVVIDQDTYGAVRTLYERGSSKKGIARELGLDIKTVRKWLREPWKEQTRQAPAGKLDAFKKFVDARAPEVGCNGQVLFREARELGYEGSYVTLSRYLTQLRQDARLAQVATVRFETDPGHQAQVDWGETKLFIGGDRKRIHFFTMVLGYSRRIFAYGFENERMENFLHGHALAFDHFGGRTAQILYDNPRTVVKSRSADGKHVEWNGRFKDRMDFYGVDARLCRYYRARTKGKVESGVKYVKRNAVAGRQFDSMDALNSHLNWWCREVADRREHGTTHEQPLARFLRAERDKMIVVEKRPPITCMGELRTDSVRVASRRVPNDAFVVVETNRYPVDYAWIGATVAVSIQTDKVILRHQGELLEHQRLDGRHQVARWNGEARRLPGEGVTTPTGPPRFDPDSLRRFGEVEIRSLLSYSELCEEATR